MSNQRYMRLAEARPRQDFAERENDPLQGLSTGYHNADRTLPTQYWQPTQTSRSDPAHTSRRLSFRATEEAAFDNRVNRAHKGARFGLGLVSHQNQLRVRSPVIQSQ